MDWNYTVSTFSHTTHKLVTSIFYWTVKYNLMQHNWIQTWQTVLKLKKKMCIFLEKIMDDGQNR